MRFEKNELPTMRQIGYLTELEKLGEASSPIMRVARKCETNHAAVSRFFKSCSENGILTEDYRFTEYGGKWLHDYLNLIGELRNYLDRPGLKEEETERVCRLLIENTEPHILQQMIAQAPFASAAQKRENARAAICEAVRKEGEHKVGVCFYRMEGVCSGNHFSMANGGFERWGVLKWINGRVYLVLTLREMSARSRIDGREMRGYLRTLKYSEGDFLREANKIDGRVLLPLDVFRIWRGQGGVNCGVLSVTVTCSVGDEHMPESTAAMVFWA